MQRSCLRASCWHFLYILVILTSFLNSLLRKYWNAADAEQLPPLRWERASSGWVSWTLQCRQSCSDKIRRSWAPDGRRVAKRNRMAGLGSGHVWHNCLSPPIFFLFLLTLNHSISPSWFCSSDYKCHFSKSREPEEPLPTRGPARSMNSACQTRLVWRAERKEGCVTATRPVPGDCAVITNGSRSL